ncbi:hypothetical protein L1077_01170 [Pseudoalteromonas luteoviolacea]|uniref:hypothetical protein n=1 Tax=Pseudoalteromonas luteoviolacea TaxID=43657 RepID=UPI001F468CB7|nr:hypothetical protein [Pseudoalteromonas luteoviolacea]MCF6438045.1 hypothetical protein [Pseudoalteromonas luteoviolacea]
MSSWKFAQSLADELSTELGYEDTQLWLVKEISFLLGKYPELDEFIGKNRGELSLSDIFVAFFEMLRKRKKINKNKYFSRLKSIKWENLHQVRLSNYLIAGLAFSIALKYCFNHKYNNDEYIRWKFDCTDSKKLIDKNLKLNKFFSSSDKKTSGSSWKQFKP